MVVIGVDEILFTKSLMLHLVTRRKIIFWCNQNCYDQSHDKIHMDIATRFQGKRFSHATAGKRFETGLPGNGRC